MRTVYKGHVINVERDGGLVVYSIFRICDGYECTSGADDSAETHRSMTAHMKRRIDAELATDDPWMEQENDQ